jgi:predicted esterase
MGQERYAWASTRNLATSIDRALNALHEKFGRYCSSNPMVYVGFSQGATLAGQYLIDNAARFPAVVLAEGGYNFMGEPWFAQKFFQGGGRRVLLLCGTPSCLTRAERARRTLERAGLNVIVGGDPKAGHNLNGTMQKAIRKHWHGLVSGMVGWETYTAHRWPE